MNIGEKLQYYREKAGLSQEELGQKLFVSRQTISQWEMNEALPTLEQLARLKVIYGIPVDAFLTDDEPAESRKEEPGEKYDSTGDGQESQTERKVLPPEAVPYAVNHRTGDKPLETPYRSISRILFTLSILSIFGALFCIEHIGTYSGSAAMVGMLERMWMFFLFTPLPIASVIFGFLMKARGYKYKKNVVAGIIMTVLLCIYGSFTFIFDDIFTHSDVPILQAEEQTGIDIPDYSAISTQDLTQGTQNFSREYVFSISDVHFDQPAAGNFEKQIAGDSRWMSVIPNDLIGTMSSFSYPDSFDYCTIYNIDTGEFNTLPEKAGTYRFYNLLYSRQDRGLRVIEYTIEYAK